MATCTDSGSRSTDIIYHQKMSACDGAAFVFPFLLVGAVGRVELKGFFHVLVSSPAVFLGLTFLEDVSSHDICVDGEVGHLCDSLSDFLAGCSLSAVGGGVQAEWE